MLSCRNVCLSYDGKPAVEDATFDVNSRDYLCVVGENGSGKSTLMKCVLGLIRQTSGSVEFDGINRREIGYLPQQTAIQRDFPASVHEVVLSGCINRHGPFSFYSRADRERADENIERLGMSGSRRLSYRDLSGGQRQRVLLARALVAANKMIMLDEPMSGLDPVVAQEMYGLLEELNSDGMTIMMISHDIRSAVQYGNKILHLDGKPIFFGSTDEYVKTDAYRRIKGYGDD
ncbi:MAG: ABC transporter ATP-binding protein [Synergistaceae bacterium]|nr:ABC transporter ATP-binding protein [Synergistaceae bacterium]